MPMRFLCYKFSVSKKNKRKELKQMIEFSGFTEKANSALNSSIKTASSLGHTYVGSEHILCGLLSDESGVAGHESKIAT